MKQNIFLSLLISFFILYSLGCDSDKTSFTHSNQPQTPSSPDKNQSNQLTPPSNDNTNISKKDTIAPFIFLLGTNPIEIYEHENFHDPGVIAQDNIDGDLTSKVKIIHNINTQVAGKYKIVYSVKDSANNSTRLIRMVIVKKREVNEPKAIECSDMSLSVGIREKIKSNENADIIWESNNTAVTVDSNGYIFAKNDTLLTNNSQALVTGVYTDNSATIKCNITVVNWRANLSKLEIEKNSNEIYQKSGYFLGEILLKDGQDIYFSAANNLYKSSDGLNSITRVGSIPASKWGSINLIKTKYGYYLKVDDKIYKSNNLSSGFIEVASTDSNSLRHAFVYDEKSGYLYAGDYTLDHNATKSIYRGKVTPSGLQNWKKIFTFDSYTNNSSNSVYHVHVVTVDPYTGNVWIATGDDDEHSKIYYSTDHGESFTLFKSGSQQFRTLSIWFTKDYIYWNTDSASANQVISRVKRTNLNKVEIVAELANGSHWYHTWVKDNQGEELVLMSASAEGKKRDLHARVFGIKERHDGSVDVQELLLIKPKKGSLMPEFVQLTPILQDDEGYIYLRGRETDAMVYKAKLTWIDQ